MGQALEFIEQAVGGVMAMHGGMRIKARHKKGQKPFVKQRVESELTHDTGKYNDRTIIADRENDLYTEIIKDPKTGEIIYKCIEPLSKHTGHGDAKKKKI